LIYGWAVDGLVDEQKVWCVFMNLTILNPNVFLSYKALSMEARLDSEDLKMVLFSIKYRSIYPISDLDKIVAYQS
jgi:hypothetical protein